MDSSSIILPLRSAHAEGIYALSEQVYPGGFALTLEELRQTLEVLTEEENLCFGVFQEGCLTGYLMCWLDTSQVEGRESEPVLLLDDIVVVERSRGQFFGLLGALRQGILARGWQQLAIEGTHRQQAERLFARHPGVVRKLGYQLGSSYHYFGEREQEPLCWARYEPVQEESRSNFDSPGKAAHKGTV